MNRRRPNEGRPGTLGVFNINPEPPEVPPLFDPENQVEDEGPDAYQYCTHECLRGVVEGLKGALDKSCPNWRAHGGRGKHELNAATLRAHLTQQILEDKSYLKLTPFQGSNAIIFQVHLRYLGYTMIAKGMSIAMSHDRKKRRKNKFEMRPYYDELWDVQGEHLPVYLGAVQFYGHVDEDDVYELELYSFAGQPLTEHLNDHNHGDMRRAMNQCVDEIQACKVIIDDFSPEDFLWDEKHQQVMLINLLNAKFRPPPRSSGHGVSARRRSVPEARSESGSGEDSSRKECASSEANDAESDEEDVDDEDEEDRGDEDEDNTDDEESNSSESNTDEFATEGSSQHKRDRKRTSPDSDEERSQKRVKAGPGLPFRPKV